MCRKDADGMANSVDPDQTAPKDADGMANSVDPDQTVGAVCRSVSIFWMHCSMVKTSCSPRVVKSLQND